AQPRQVHLGKGGTAENGHSAFAAAQGACGPVLDAHLPLARHAQLFQESKGGEGVPEVGAFQARVREVVRLAKGLCHAHHARVGEAQGVGRGPGDGALQGCRQAWPHARLLRSFRQEGGRGALEVHHRRHVRQGRTGNACRGSRQMGWGRTQKGLRLAGPSASAGSPAEAPANVPSPVSALAKAIAGERMARWQSKRSPHSIHRLSRGGSGCWKTNAGLRLCCWFRRLSCSACSSLIPSCAASCCRLRTRASGWPAISWASPTITKSGT